MNFKLKELQVLSNSLEQIIQIEMIQRTAYWLGRIHKKINSELKEFNESHTKLEKKYGAYKYKQGKETLTFNEEAPERGSWLNEKGEKMENFQPNPSGIYWKANNNADFDLFMKELKDLEETEIKIDFAPVKISDLVRNEAGGQTVPLNIRPKLLSDLEPIFTEELSQ